MGYQGEKDIRVLRKIIIIVPRIDNTGPVKGALALLNGLKNLNINCEIFSIYDQRRKCKNRRQSLISIIKKIYYLRSQQNNGAVLITYCLLPDLITSIFLKPQKSIVSIRGNLKKNYTDTYGAIGEFVAFFHHMIVRRFGYRTVLNLSMRREVEKFGVTAVEIKNFIDEIDYPKIPAKVEGGANFVFVFVGSMTNRKGVLLLLKTFYKLSKVHANLKLHLVGDGPEIYKVRKFVKDTNLSELVIIHGQLDTPLEIVARSDYFVLPSLSEGTSRAAMEALYLGLPCIMRNVDSNSELIQSPEQGFLFDTDEELFALMERAVTDGVSRRNKTRLPIEFSQIECTKSYVNLVQAL